MIMENLSLPFDVSITIPELDVIDELKPYYDLYQRWNDTYLSSNPIQSQVEFFNSLQLEDPHFIQYWYDVYESLHPIVKQDIESFESLSDSIGIHYHYIPLDSVTNISDISSIKTPISQLLRSKLLPEIQSLLEDSFSSVNTLFENNLQNIESSSPVQSHGNNLVKDEIFPVRIASSKTQVRETIKQELGDQLFKISQIDDQFEGDKEIHKSVYKSRIEGKDVVVDDLSNKITSSQWLEMEKLTSK